MNPIYQHTQPGTVMLAIMIVPVLGLVFAVALTWEPEALLPLLLILAFMAATMAAFSSLTVSVDAQRVQLTFGLGLLRRSIPLEQVKEVRVVRNPVWMGLGIHFIPRGMIYNISGLGGVEITLHNDRRVRIGSDEPLALAQAVQAAIRK
jgi:hypothetical protein